MGRILRNIFKQKIACNAAAERKREP